MTGQLAPDVKAKIEQRLAAIEQEDGVRVLLAVESGSRAWGFPSPDSDYDVRFVYVRPRDAYLALHPVRDVIERPIVDVIDLAGWDLRKALLLLLKSNATVSEWLESPIRYRKDDPIIASLTALADALFDPRGMARHYAGLCRNALERGPRGDASMGVKRYFYALRPALALRALYCDATRRPAMNVQDLMARADLAPSLVRQIDALVRAKAATREAGLVARFPELDAFICEQLERVETIPERPLPADAGAMADVLFLDCVTQ